MAGGIGYKVQLNDCVPIAWFKRITFANGKPHLNACLILTEIINQYQAKFGGIDGKVVPMRNEFMLNTSYQTLGGRFSLSKRQTALAVKALAEHGMIFKEVRNINIDGVTFANALLVRPNYEAIANIDPNSDHVCTVVKPVEQGCESGMGESNSNIEATATDDAVIDVPYEEVPQCAGDGAQLEMFSLTEYTKTAEGASNQKKGSRRTSKSSDSDEVHEVHYVAEKPIPNKMAEELMLDDADLDTLESFKIFLDLYNEMSPRCWTKHKVIPPRALSFLRKWCKKYGREKAIKRWKGALTRVSANQFYKKTPFNIASFCSNGKPDEMYQEYVMYGDKDPRARRIDDDTPNFEGYTDPNVISQLLKERFIENKEREERLAKLRNYLAEFNTEDFPAGIPYLAFLRATNEGWIRNEQEFIEQCLIVRPDAPPPTIAA